MGVERSEDPAASGSHRQPEAVIIADDFTGANDTGVQLSKYGIPTVTVLALKNISDFGDYPGIVLDTESRHLSKQEARTRLEAASAYIGGLGHDPLVYKKVDSMLRGNIGVELGTLADKLDFDLIVFAPAYPRNGRETVDGTHMINGVPVAATEAGEDPLTPVTTSSIRHIAEADNGLEFRHVNLKDIRNGGIPEITKYGGAFSFDSETEGDLVTIVKDIAESGKSVLWSGSAGLADVLMRHCYGTMNGASVEEPQQSTASLQRHDQPSRQIDPFLAVIGSTARVNSEQLRKAGQISKSGDHRPLMTIFMDNERIIARPDAEYARIKTKALEYFDAGYDVAIATEILSATTEFERKRLLVSGVDDRGRTISSSEETFSMSRCVGELAAEIIECRELRGVMVTGGETALYLASRLDIKGFSIEYELEPGVPVISSLSKTEKGLGFVTKAGAFGTPNIISKAANCFK